MTDTSPTRIFESITPSDDPEDNFSQRPRAIYVGGQGTVVAINFDDEQVSFVNVPEGTELHIRPKRIHSTGTSATNLVAYY